MNKVLAYIKENKTFLIVMTLYTIITFLRVLFHQPWFDEAHAWTIADELNLAQIFDLMKIEGHTFVWYLLLMPFAKTNFHYPYPMLIMNWLFCWGALFLVWKKAPFNNIIKTLLTFSFPFLGLYAIIARCYAIGILFIFALCAMYKKQLNYPYLYSTIIVLCANTSVMALVGAAAFGFLFVFNLLKSFVQKTDGIDIKKLIISFIILLFGAVLIFMQLGGASGDHVSGIAMAKDGINLTFFTNAFVYNKIITFAIIVLGLIVFPIMLYKNKQSLFFITFTFTSLLLIFQTTYLGYMWHHYFFLIYLIAALWILLDCEKGFFLFKKTGIILLMVILASYVIDFRYTKLYFNNGSKYLSQIILKDDTLKNSRLIFLGDFELRLLPYLKNKNVDTYSYCQSEKASYKTDKYESPYCQNTRYSAITIEGLEQSFSDEKQNILVQAVDNDMKVLGIENGFIIEGEDKKATLTPYKKFGKDLYFFTIKIDKIR